MLEGLSDESGTDFSDDEVAELRRKDEFKPVKGKPGMFYKVSNRSSRKKCLFCRCVICGCDIVMRKIWGND